ncbi:dipeptidyl aminopeptidase/acylaminoacyl peptidase [Thermosporothrix hazakensis]|uniref:Dipeptidyl aminopeptidase/acylaminoacyl peptidase n=1 Tax=Thermosporothrix hazakensis TaxID=644383 RepID=A0A326UC99_THEHA|nr:S9 family peptidase [Thermosporothrix hazakensis]PZW26306.1 dipeptidyl aminopeptidase/acylaminoacyl peptidase [Thermosporothrix hazakensis]GCE48742.1 putative peptidase YuxL [Thermosporothrix hazakensis]
MGSVSTPTISSLHSVPPDRIPLKPGSRLQLRSPMQVRISPDGKQAAFILGEWREQETYRIDRLYTLDLSREKAQPRPLTRETQGDKAPCWSPDGKYIAYISTPQGENEKAQIYLAPAAGGEPRRVCTMPNGVLDLAWSPDSQYLAFTTLEGDEPEGDPLVLTPDRYRRLWAVHIDSDAPYPLTCPELSIWEFSWSPDSSQLALYYSTGPGENGWYAGQVGVISAHGGSVRQLSLLDRQASNLAWSPDGRYLAYISGDWSDRCHGAGDIFLVSVADGATRDLTPGIEYSPCWCTWLPDGQRLLFVAYQGVTHVVATLEVENGTINYLEHDFPLEAASDVSITPDARSLLVLHTTSQEPTDIWLGKLSESADSLKWRRVSQLNPVFEATYALAPTKRLCYSSLEGWEIDALLTMPLVRKTDELPPLVVHVHGGPSGAWIDDAALRWTQLLAGAGYAVFRPNIRGSWGRGVTFADAVVGDMGGNDYQDILFGIEYLVNEGLVDPNRIGIMGWSYGGFMSAWAVTQTQRFKAAVIGASITDWHSFHAQSAISDWDIRFMKADYLRNPDAYRRWSPITYAAQVQTPCLILHGEKDVICPVNQAYGFYRALMDRGVPVEAVIYPREGHGPRERKHNIDIDERILRWFEKYL